jgi:hypothetical protein
MVKSRLHKLFLEEYSLSRGKEVTLSTKKLLESLKSLLKYSEGLLFNSSHHRILSATRPVSTTIWEILGAGKVAELMAIRVCCELTEHPPFSKKAIVDLNSLKLVRALYRSHLSRTKRQVVVATRACWSGKILFLEQKLLKKTRTFNKADNLEERGNLRLKTKSQHLLTVSIRSLQVVVPTWGTTLPKWILTVHPSSLKHAKAIMDNSRVLRKAILVFSAPCLTLSSISAIWIQFCNAS